MTDKGTSPSAGNQVVRWRRLLAWAGVGCCCWVVAFFLWPSSNKAAFLSDVLLEIGTALALVGVVFLVQRQLTATLTRGTQKIVQESEVRTKNVVEESETRTKESTNALETRMDELEDQFKKSLAAKDAEQDLALAALQADAGFDSVTRAIEAANDIGALAAGYPTVEASTDPDELSLEFRWITTVGPGGWPTGAHLTVHAQIEADLEGVGGRPVIEVDWSAGKSAADVGVELVTELRRRDRWTGKGTLDWTLALRNLSRTLEVAVRSHRHDPGAWDLHGAVFELAQGRWAITTAGLECPAKSYLLAQVEFPGPLVRGKEASPWEPPKPSWAELTEWRRVLKRAVRLLPTANGPARAAPSWTPMTSALRAHIERPSLRRSF